MPLYEYACPRCNAKTERQTKIADRVKDLPECPDCHLPMTPIMSAPQGGFPGADSWRRK